MGKENPVLCGKKLGLLFLFIETFIRVFGNVLLFMLFVWGTTHQWTSVEGCVSKLGPSSKHPLNIGIATLVFCVIRVVFSFTYPDAPEWNLEEVVIPAAGGRIIVEIVEVEPPAADVLNIQEEAQ